jgi:L-lysine 6-transaminase
VLKVPKNVFEEESRINSTWGGNLVDMVRSSQYLKIIRDDKLIDNAAKMGTVLQAGLSALAKKHDVMSNVRGRGLFCAFTMPSQDIRNKFLDTCREKEQLIILPSGTSSVRFRPFLDVDADAIADGFERMEKVLKKF